MLQRGSFIGHHSKDSSTLPQTIKLRQRADEQAVAGDGGSGHAHFVEGVFVQQLIFGARGEDVGVAVLA